MDKEATTTNNEVKETSKPEDRTDFYNSAIFIEGKRAIRNGQLMI